MDIVNIIFAFCCRERTHISKQIPHVGKQYLTVGGIASESRSTSCIWKFQWRFSFGIAETNIDDTFSDGQFQVENCKLYRQDRNDRGGGIMMYINDDTPHSLLKQFSGI